METLHLDLTHNATRRYILQLLEAQLEGGHDWVAAHVKAVGVPRRHHHDIGEVDTTIDALANVSDKVKADMHAIYRILAEAEAQVHGCPVEQTHFHEVGNADAIENVLAICLALEALSPARVVATSVQVGSGQVECAHGILDVPAPATQAILDRGIPVCEQRLEGELCTPTSAAVLYHIVDEFL